MSVERLTIENKENDPLLGKAFVSCDVKDCILLSCEADAPCEKMQALIDRLFDIEEILGDEYDLGRLRVLVEADRDGRIKVEPRARRCPKCGKHKVFPRIDWKYFYCYSCNTQFSANEYTKALKGEQGG